MIAGDAYLPAESTHTLADTMWLQCWLVVDNVCEIQLVTVLVAQ